MDRPEIVKITSFDEDDLPDGAYLSNRAPSRLSDLYGNRGWYDDSHPAVIEKLASGHLVRCDH
jgi:hypothetical protein